MKTMRNPLLISSVLGIGHGISDCMAGFLVGSLTGSTVAEKATFLLLYNALAFAGQVPVGLLLDKWRAPKLTLGISLLFGLAGIVCFQFSVSPYLALTFAGIGSAGYHVSGGWMALDATPGKAKGAGLFAAPGVVGLVLGGWLAWKNLHPEIILIAAVFAIGMLIFFLPLVQHSTNTAEEKHDGIHDGIMILLLAGIAFRSASWNIFQLLTGHEFVWLFPIAIAAAAGKISGGFIADRIGWRLWTVSALLTSSILFSIAPQFRVMVIPGIFLLQSATAPALALIRKSLPQRPATSAALGLGLGIALGGFLVYAGASFVLPVLFSAVAALFYFWSFRHHPASIKNPS